MNCKKWKETSQLDLECAFYPILYVVLNVLANDPNCYLNIVNKLQKLLCIAAAPNQASSLERLATLGNAPSPNLLYRYYFESFSSGILLFLTFLLN